MPIYAAEDVRKALGGPALPACVCRSLLQRGFNFRDPGIDDSKRIALSLVLRDAGAEMKALVAARKEKKMKAEDKAANTDLSSDKRERARVEATRLGNEIDRIAPLAARPSQPEVLERSRVWLDRLPPSRRRSFTLTTRDRLLLGLSDGPLENAGMQLDRFFGVPFLAGSALKGIACDAAGLVDGAEAERDSIFGSSVDERLGRRGAVAFLPAYPTNADAKIVLDVCTPHYKSYYGRTANPTILDDEDPEPSLFPAVARGVEFQFDLVVLLPGYSDSHAENLLALAEQCLIAALTAQGIGAKTRSGYGRFSPPNCTVLPEGDDLFPVPPPSLRDQWPAAKVVAFNAARIAKAIHSLGAENWKGAFADIIPIVLRDDISRRNNFWVQFYASAEGRAILEAIGKKPQ